MNLKNKEMITKMAHIARILQVVSELNQGGIENFIMNLYRTIDREKIQFDFIVHHSAKGQFEDEIKALGGRVYHFPVFDNKNILKYIMDLNSFFKNHSEYKVVHGHLASMGFIYLTLAKKYNVPCRIAHSHGTSAPKSIKGFIKSILFKFFKKSANVQFACSTEAGLFLFKDEKSYKIIPNAIDFNRFKYNLEKRIKYRKQLGLGDSYVIGHVGRFTVEKNHAFILDLFCKILDEDRNAKLLLVGDGKLRTMIQDKAKKLNIDKNVLFTGNRSDVENLYNAMDAFILPSLFEGLPVTGVEAQVCGLPSFFSSNVTKEVKVSELANFISLENIEEWKDKLLSVSINKERNSVNIINSDFNINNLAKYFEEYYSKYYKKGN